jgi:hypothetical protein
MQFNIKMCKVMHLGFNNACILHGGHQLEVTEEERDIGVSVIKNLKHCKKAARTAQVVLSQTSRAFHYLDRIVFLKLYVQYRYVRPHLVFASPVWSPWLESDKELLEKIQKRAVKWCRG